MKFAKEERNMRRILVLLFVILIPSLVMAQGYGAQKSDAKIQLQFERFAFGVGSIFAETFSTDSLFGAVQIHAIGMPFIQEGTSTGIMLEGHLGKLFGKEVVTQSLDNMDWRLWSMSRVPISAVPVKALQSGIPKRVFAGTDILLAEGGPFDWTDGFEARFVIGGDLGVVWKGNLVIEIYAFQKDVPVAFGFIYGF